ncbi:hypothetical protein Tmath_0807 [Thermoanaerobacter mathranii subsp. mathranii str. A3]|uniref:Uncharacterized protein n=1 Tax=Thermoanaerobacter mathranii subsp. mathranii (strain DSM 11426 / CCUG 53645 / CIP 108742 / A3) TaxID=583358 RepID=A0ABN3Z3W8_THEM3|nr:hypothetical protein [Thermoanaerobacter mathranii]ADH60545.1 hypothetical protein Tmath_0807 [Thermoanaerobacter mathranii subsp. mathranii str. A3]
MKSRQMLNVLLTLILVVVLMSLSDQAQPNLTNLPIFFPTKNYLPQIQKFLMNDFNKIKVFGLLEARIAESEESPVIITFSKNMEQINVPSSFHGSHYSDIWTFNVTDTSHPIEITFIIPDWANSSSDFDIYLSMTLLILLSKVQLEHKGKKQ